MKAGFGTPVRTNGAVSAVIWQLNLAAPSLSEAINNQAIEVDFRIVGKERALGTACNARLQALYTRIAGTTALAGALQTIQAVQGSLAGAFTFTADVSGTTIRLSANGVVATDVDWFTSGSMVLTG
jgi:hypothetical protein